MILQTKFDLGDLVLYWDREPCDEEIMCDFCGGEGVAQDYLGHLVECPACEGRGHFTEESHRNVKKAGRIRNINIHWQTNGTKEIRYDITDSRSWSGILEKNVIEKIEFE